MPILGSGDDGILCNCRQISLLPQFSKILEELNEGRLSRFLEKMNSYVTTSMVSDKMDQQ